MSGAAGLIYEVAWTRLLALRLGHTTAAAATVAGAFMGGLAVGAAAGGWLASRVSSRRALQLYAAVELLVILVALTLPRQLEAATPLLRAAYGDGTPGWSFSLIRGATTFATLLLPAVGLGASFPFAVRARAVRTAAPGLLYAVNTLGAALGAAAAGFVLLPSLGLWRTTLAGASLSAVAMCVALALAARSSDDDENVVTVHETAKPTPGRRRRLPKPSPAAAIEFAATARWEVLLIAAVTGLAGFVLEIAWTRVFALVAGPSAYAFAATLTCFITGLALGALTGQWMAARSSRMETALAVTLCGAGLASAIATRLAGSWLPARIVSDLAASRDPYLTLLTRHALWTGALVVPAVALLGAAFPLMLRSSATSSAAASASSLYAVNTAAGVVGSLAAGFVLLPQLGLRETLFVPTALLSAAGAYLWVRASAGQRLRRSLAALPIVAVALIVTGGSWNRPLLASGAYKYARYLPPDGDLEAMLTAGDLQYYRDGASATVAVRERAGIRTLSIDGKVDASSGSDMTTQKVLAHLPLLLHRSPKRVLVIGLGSGVTAGAALTHPVDRVDVVEISPEVVDASDLFVRENRNALKDPRTHLIVGDGRSHLLLANTRYDVIVSEPSNPWMAGVAALFTREFFEAARARLAPGGVLCQWTHTYDISLDDLRSIAATFASVFPHGTMWLLGEGDLLLVGSNEPLTDRSGEVETHWTRPGVAADLADARVLDPFSLLSTQVGGPPQLLAFARGAAVQLDDRMALEYTGPRALNDPSSTMTADVLAALQEEARAEPTVTRSLRAASAEQWRRRGAMMLASDAFASAYVDFERALTLDTSSVAAGEGFVRAAVAGGREASGIERLSYLARAHPESAAPLVALSRLHAGVGQFEEAARAAIAASRQQQTSSEAFEQLASVYADAGDADGLAAVVDALRALFPDARATAYYGAALSFLQGNLPSAQRLVEHATAVDQTYAPAHNRRGAIYASAGDIARARDAFRAALELDPRDTSIYTNLGRLEAELGDDAAAARLFAEALTLDPDLEPAREGLADIRRRKRR